MCRNIRPLFNFDPPASDEEIRASALQFVRKVSGFSKPSHANAEAFDRAVDEVADAARRLVFSLRSAAPPRDRKTEALKSQERARRRFVRTADHSAKVSRTARSGKDVAVRAARAACAGLAFDVE